MAQRRKIEVFTAGCPCCTEAVELVDFLAGTEHDIEICDMHDPAVAIAAAGYGIRRLPAIVIERSTSRLVRRGRYRRSGPVPGDLQLKSRRDG